MGFYGQQQMLSWPDDRNGGWGWLQGRKGVELDQIVGVKRSSGERSHLAAVCPKYYTPGRSREYLSKQPSLWLLL